MIEWILDEKPQILPPNIKFTEKNNHLIEHNSKKNALLWRRLTSKHTKRIMYPPDITKENIGEILQTDIEQLDDHQLVEYGYKLQSVWEGIDSVDFEMDIKPLFKTMRGVYYSVLKRAQQTEDLERLATLVPSLPYLIYSPNLPEVEDCFEPVDALVWGFAQKVSEQPMINDSIKIVAIQALLEETKDIDLEILMEEPVYVWSINNQS